MAMGWLVQYVPVPERKEAHVVDGEPIGTYQEFDGEPVWLITKTPIETRTDKASEVIGSIAEMPSHRPLPASS